MTTIYILHGPNLDRLGKRQPEVYGRTTHAELAARCVELGRGLGLDVVVRQTNSEAQLVAWIHEVADAGAPAIINAAALTHTSVAVRDAAAELHDGAGFLELHLSNVYAREAFRHHSYLSDLAVGVIAGLGITGYDAALQWWAERLV